MLVAQCTGSAPCDLPTGVPWYFGLVIAAIWLGFVVGSFAIGRRVLQARRERRRAGDQHRRDDGRAIEGTSSSGTDVEPW